MNDVDILKVPFRFNTYTLSSWDRSIIDLISKIDGLWCAGGASLAMYINNIRHLNDWDLFAENNNVINDVEGELSNLGFNNVKVEGFLSEWVKGEGSGACNVQIISKHLSCFKNQQFLQTVFDDFDISVCKVGFCDDSFFYLSKDAYLDIKNYTFNVSIISGKTNNRIEKYKNKGFVFNEKSLQSAVKKKATY